MHHNNTSHYNEANFESKTSNVSDDEYEYNLSIEMIEVDIVTSDFVMRT